MVYWIAFHILLIFFLVLADKKKKNNKDKYYKWIIIAIMVYFSGYRDGLGADYSTYLLRIEVVGTPDSFIYGLTEPLFTLFEYIIKVSILSPIFLFLLSAFFTNYGIVRYLYKDNNLVIFSVLVFVLLPATYTMSFNIVRQFFSVGLFFISLRYVGVSFKKYFIIIIIATLIHLSAIILLPLYWILQINLSKQKILLVASAFFIIAPFILSFVASGDSKYAEEASSDNVSTLSGIIIIYNLFFLILLFNKKCYNGLSVINRNLFVWYIILLNASYINYYFFRLSVYLSPVLAIVIPVILNRIDHRNKLNVLCITILFVFQYYTLLSNIDDKLIVPSKMYSPLSIFDNFYNSELSLQ